MSKFLLILFLVPAMASAQQSMFDDCQSPWALAIGRYSRTEKSEMLARYMKGAAEYQGTELEDEMEEVISFLMTTEVFKENKKCEEQRGEWVVEKVEPESE